MQNQLEAAGVFLGRLLIAVLFLGGALQKTLDPAPASQLLLDFGLPAGLVWPALAFNALAGIALLLGVQVRLVALLAADYCGFTSMFHYLPDDAWQMTIFVKNWAIAGGSLVLSVHGAGAWALQPRR